MRPRVSKSIEMPSPGDGCKYHSRSKEGVAFSAGMYYALEGGCREGCPYETDSIKEAWLEGFDYATKRNEEMGYKCRYVPEDKERKPSISALLRWALLEPRTLDDAIEWLEETTGRGMNRNSVQTNITRLVKTGNITIVDVHMVEGSKPRYVYLWNKKRKQTRGSNND